MKLIIEIDDDVYKHTVERSEYDTLSFGYSLMNAVANGTPLPKGYGDLVDFDRLCEEYWDGNYMEIHKDDLLNIKPIIKADKEG